MTYEGGKEGNLVNVEPLRSPAEIKEFREALKLSKQADRNMLLFNLGINTGLRIGDIVKLRIEDVKGASSIVVSEGKTKKPRRVHLNAIMGDIADYLSDKPNEGWLFPSRKGDGHITSTQAYRIYAKAADLLGRKDIGTHTGRKTFGYHYYQRTKDVATLMEIFNHSDQATTKRYIGITEDEIADTLKDFRL
ncbi:Phage integrase family protein [Halobacillus dabanensis]|uniref:Phage integrase family protein n=1 Tax=Halobacillus dabanensis TaxID=240302 RepID=A0A1I3WXK4_HALDA|nr:tyrosine-type recombinase/integrase [Halobacillus dabanensis]SFK12218.1 Phage integrase family protein [Halobacillus dabanensis]